MNTIQNVSFLNIDYKKINFNEPKINFFYLDPPYKKININDILIFFSIKKILSKNALGILELPIDENLNNLDGYEIWKKKKVSKSMFYFIAKKTSLFSSKKSSQYHSTLTLHMLVFHDYIDQKKP